MPIKLLNTIALVIITGAFSSCLNDKGFDERDYPEDIARIILPKCATSGCHNTASKDAASGLSLSTWAEMMEGSRNGAVTIPYTYPQSSMFLFTNTYDDIGISVPPSMPYNQQPLTREEVLTLRYWISEGAPNKEGYVKFSDNPTRQKYYVVNRGCDLVAVMDRQTDLIMRFVKTTFNLDIEYAEEIHISPDGQYWYVTSRAGQVIQKYRTSDDSYVGALLLDAGAWKSFCIMPDSKKAWVVNAAQNGEIAYLNLENMEVINKFSGSTHFARPYGICFNANLNVLYIGAENGNLFHKVDITNPANPQFNEIVIPMGQLPDTASAISPKQVFLHPDGTKYYVACKGIGAVKVFDASNDNLISTIQVGVGPETFAYSSSKNYLVVACTEDTLSFPEKRGSISFIDCSSNSVIKKLHPGSQPHGMVVDELNNRLIVANRNFSEDGPKPHHVTECEGRNGYISYVSLATLEMASTRRYEVSVDPINIVMRE